jgi:hypothetical protein
MDVIALYLLFGHDLFGKPLHTFPDDAQCNAALRAVLIAWQGAVTLS